MEEQISKIEMTNSAKMFRFVKGNRQIVASKIKNLIKSYESGLNLFPYCPILVNNDNFVIDGQHRLETCKKLKLPIYYIVVPNMSILDIAKINAMTTKWSINDFFNCFVEGENKDYQTLQFFKDKYSLTVNVAVQLLMSGSLAEGGGHFADRFRSGEFVVKHKQKAENIMTAVMQYEDCAEEAVIRDRSFIRSIQMLLASDLYKHDEVVQKLKDRKIKLSKKSNHKEYIFHIEELFNRGNSKRQFIFQSPTTK